MLEAKHVILLIAYRADAHRAVFCTAAYRAWLRRLKPKTPQAGSTHHLVASLVFTNQRLYHFQIALRP